MTEPDVQALIAEIDAVTVYTSTDPDTGFHWIDGIGMGDKDRLLRKAADALTAKRAEIARLRTAAEDMRERAAKVEAERDAAIARAARYKAERDGNARRVAKVQTNGEQNHTLLMEAQAKIARQRDEIAHIRALPVAQEGK